MKMLFCVVFALAFVGAAVAGEWHIETVDSEGNVGSFSSLALDSLGYPHISYCDDTNDDLKYARWNGSSWQMVTLDSPTWWVSNTSLALDSSDYPCISYNFGGSGMDGLKYAHWDGSSWHLECVETNGGGDWGNSLALDSSDHPHISYFNQYEMCLYYARWNGSSWQIEFVDSLGAMCSLALDSSGYPHISNCGGYYNLKYTHWNGDTWQIETVDGAWGGTSLALDSSDRPHISYYYGWIGPDSILKYARWDGDAWQIETVDLTGTRDGQIACSSLALDDSDYPHIAYYDVNNTDLKYARWGGDTWQIETVDSVGDVGGYASLELDSSGDPHISYYDGSNGDLKYAYWEGGPGVEGAELSVGVGDGGVLVGWTITGDIPASFSVLRSVGDNDSEAVSGALPGEATRWLDDDVGAGVAYRYWLEVTEDDGTVSRFGPSEAVAYRGSARQIVLDVYPSPASASLSVEFTLLEAGRVTVALYDLSGRRVTTVYDGETTAGRHDTSYDASLLPPGVYLARLTTDSGSLTRRVVVAR